MDLIFSTGIHSESLNNPILNKQLEKLGRQLTKNSNVTQKSAAGGLQARAPDLQHPVLLDFFKAATLPLQELVKHYHINGNYRFGFQDVWFNLNKKGDYNMQHAHGNTDFSAVYYIKCAPGSGDIVFVNPNQARFLLNLSSVFKFKEYTTINSDTYSIKPKQMELCVFPAELQHYVTRNNNNADRLSLAFNVRIIPVDEN